MDEKVFSLIDITEEEFHLITRLVYDKFGINLTDQKKSLVVGRLNKVLKNLGLTSFREYYHYVTEEQSGQALSALVDKISTNHSFFFREKDHFDFLQSTILPTLALRKKEGETQSLRIWSAGCAAGEEIYTIAMIVREFLGQDLSGWDTGLLATDISLAVLNEARKGVYVLDKIKEVTPQYRSKYFTLYEGEKAAVREDLKSMVLFKRMNLMRDKFPFKGKFQVIFCRNVMIYFDNATRLNLVNKLADFIEDGGYLFIGHSESLGRENGRLKYVRPAVYQKI